MFMLSENRKRLYSTDILVRDLKEYEDFDYLDGLGPAFSEVQQFYMDIIFDYDGVDIREWKSPVSFKLDKYSNPGFHTIIFETVQKED